MSDRNLTPDETPTSATDHGSASRESDGAAAGSTGLPSQGRPGARLARNMAFYTILRLLLVVLIVLGIIGLGQLVGVDVPVLVAAVIAVVIALPLSMVLFTRVRSEINSDIAAVDAGRREKRDDLRRRMAES